MRFHVKSRHRFSFNGSKIMYFFIEEIFSPCICIKQEAFRLLLPKKAH